jgi:hypothetical protein
LAAEFDSSVGDSCSLLALSNIFTSKRRSALEDASRTASKSEHSTVTERLWPAALRNSCPTPSGYASRALSCQADGGMHFRYLVVRYDGTAYPDSIGEKPAPRPSSHPALNANQINRETSCCRRRPCSSHGPVARLQDDLSTSRRSTLSPLVTDYCGSGSLWVQLYCSYSTCVHSNRDLVSMKSNNQDHDNSKVRI